MADTRRDDIAAAFAEVDDNPTETEAPETTQEVMEPEVSEESEAATPEETFEDSPAEELPAVEAAEVNEPGESEPGIVKGSNGKEAKPPVGWSPKEREHWASLPSDVQKKIYDREVHIDRLMQETAQSRRTAESFQQMVQPYTAIMAAEGVSDPMVAINNLLGTAAQLQSGNPGQKAQKIADLLSHYDIDVGLVADVLEGQQVTDPRDEKLAQLERQMQQQQQYFQQQQYQQQSAPLAQEINDFAAKNEFFEDVKYEMADLIESAERQGRGMTLERAYKLATSAHPQISEVLETRRLQQKAADNQRSIRSKKAASSSVMGRPAHTGVPPSRESLSRREAIEAAWADTGE